MIERILLNMSSDVLYRLESGKHSDEQSQKLDNLRQLAVDIRGDRTRLYFASICIGVLADSSSQMRERLRFLEVELNAYSVRYSFMRYRQLHSLMEFSLSHTPSFDRCPVVSTDTLPALLPFTQSPTAHPNGAMLGFNITDGTPVIFDRFSGLNFNCVVLGKSGSGKSFFVKSMMLRELERSHERFFVVDPLGEFGEVAMHSGGRVINVERDGLGIGSFPVSRLASVMAHLLRFFKSSLNISDRACMEIQRAMERTILATPQMSAASFFAALSESGTALDSEMDFTGIIQKLLRGEYQADAGAGITVFDLSSLDRRIVEHYIALIAGTLFETSKKLTGRKTIVVDEAWSFAGNPVSAGVLSEITRHSRHFGISLVLISQNFEDLAGNACGENIINNCSSYFIFRHENVSERMAEFFDICEEDQRFISSSQPRMTGFGRCLFISQGRKIPLLLPSSETERDICSTDAVSVLSPSELLCREAMKDLDEIVRIMGGD